MPSGRQIGILIGIGIGCILLLLFISWMAGSLDNSPSPSPGVAPGATSGPTPGVAPTPTSGPTPGVAPTPSPGVAPSPTSGPTPGVAPSPSPSPALPAPSPGEAAPPPFPPVVPSTCTGERKMPDCGVAASANSCDGYTITEDSAMLQQGYQCIWTTQSGAGACHSYGQGQEEETLCTLPDHSISVHQPCREDSDCVSGRCSMGDPGCYAANTCSAPRDAAHNAVWAGGHCGNVRSASGNP